MKLIKTTIDIKSTFLTYPKGDMLYGFFLFWWDKLKGDVNHIKEKIIFSDFLPKNYFPKPALEFLYFTNDEDKRKEIKKKEWIKKEFLINGELEKVEDIKFIKKKKRVRNNIHKLLSTTLEGFNPYVIEEIEFLQDVELYFATSLDINEVGEFLNKIGEYGFGADSSIGKGIFCIKSMEEVRFEKGNVFLAISPFVTNKEVKYNLFTRFGKKYASSNPFKKPVVLMDSGAVVFNECDLVEGKVLENGNGFNSFIQAKSIMIPFNLREKNEI
jgi:CRISPR type III-A-associated RAMP protein Csm4